MFECCIIHRYKEGEISYINQNVQYVLQSEVFKLLLRFVLREWSFWEMCQIDIRYLWTLGEEQSGCFHKLYIFILLLNWRFYEVFYGDWKFEESADHTSSLALLSLGGNQGCFYFISARQPRRTHASKWALARPVISNRSMSLRATSEGGWALNHSQGDHL